MPLRLVMLAALLASFTGADLVADLQARGIPASRAEPTDTSLVVEMTGSLAEGDTLLKHYGGVFFLVADSIAGGWEPVGIQVLIPEATLLLTREDMVAALMSLRNGMPDEDVAMHVLQRTWVFSR